MFGGEMARMEIDCSLKKMAIFFQVLSVYFRELAKD